MGNTAFIIWYKHIVNYSHISRKFKSEIQATILKNSLHKYNVKAVASPAKYLNRKLMKGDASWKAKNLIVQDMWFKSPLIITESISCIIH